MIALWIILGILGFLALLITVICLLPVYVYVYYDKENSLYYRYRLLWMVFGEVPNPNNPILRLVKDLSGLSRFDSVKSLKKSVSSLGVGTLQADQGFRICQHPLLGAAAPGHSGFHEVRTGGTVQKHRAFGC